MEKEAPNRVTITFSNPHGDTGARRGLLQRERIGLCHRHRYRRAVRESKREIEHGSGKKDNADILH